MAATDPRRWHRPQHVSFDTSTTVATLANVSVELPKSTSCGHYETDRAVLCMDTGFGLAQADQLVLLAFAASPFVLHASSEQAAWAARRVIATIPERIGNAEIRVGIKPTCSGACERRLTLESKS